VLQGIHAHHEGEPRVCISPRGKERDGLGMGQDVRTEALKSYIFADLLDESELGGRNYFEV